ncbi:MAG: amidohydrolase family protein [Acidimicrobiales bacterium]
MEDPGLPIKLNPCSNGEFAPRAPSEVVREAVRLARRQCDENARRLGMDRREFLLSSMGAATTLFALAACSSDSDNANRETTGGTFDVDEEATVDPDAALDTLGSDQPVIDVQTHLLEYPPDFAGGIGGLFPFAEECGEENPNDCFTTGRWIEELFGRSDTTVAVISALPAMGEPDPLSAEVMAQARDQVMELCGDGRVLVQGHAWPNVGELEAALDAMDAEGERHPVVAWKTYTHVGPGYTFDDSAGEPVGEAFLAKVEELGPPIVCVHKGLSIIGAGDAAFASPVDIGPAATNHPDLTLCVYHSGFEAGVAEGPYDSAAPNGGADRLVKTLEDAGIEPGGNVYAELGSTWRFIMGDPNGAAHLLGKLLLAVGEDRILWGTDSIWYGSPQDQIQAFRSFEITEQFQEQFGYPALTEEIKHKVLWRNAAQLHDIDVARLPCDVDQETSEEARRGSRLANRTYGPRTATAARQLFRAEHPWAF